MFEEYRRRYLILYFLKKSSGYLRIKLYIVGTRYIRFRLEFRNWKVRRMRHSNPQISDIRTASQIIIKDFNRTLVSSETSG